MTTISAEARTAMLAWLLDSATADLVDGAGNPLGINAVAMKKQWATDRTEVTVVAQFTVFAGLPPTIAGARLMRGHLLVVQCEVSAPPPPPENTGLDVEFHLALTA
jgi:hypothetical protein